MQKSKESIIFVVLLRKSRDLFPLCFLNFSRTALKEKLTDAAGYCYAAICALSLHDLYGNTWDMPYSQDCITKFTEHLGLPAQVNIIFITLKYKSFQLDFTCSNISTINLIVEILIYTLLQEFVIN